MKVVIFLCITVFGVFGVFGYHLDTHHLYKHRTEEHVSHDTPKQQIGFATKLRHLVENPQLRLLIGQSLQEIQKTIQSDPAMSDIKRTNPTIWECPNHGPHRCGNDTESLMDVWSEFTAGINAPDTEEDRCPGCLIGLGLIQRLICLLPQPVGWELFAHFADIICEVLMILDEEDPVVCQGLIHLQGPHLYCVALEADPREVCESANVCFPPDDRNRPPVSERYPWAVIDKLKQQGMWNSKEKTDSYAKKSSKGLANHARKSREELVMVAVITDIHLQHSHVVGSATDCNNVICCLENSNGTGSARQYGEYKCDLPPRTLDLFLERISQAKPDFVIYLGDSAPHTSWDESMTSKLNSSRLVVEAMEKSFDNNTRVYPNIGDEDMHPANIYSLRMPETREMNKAFADMWHHLAGFDDTSYETMKTMGYYTTLVPGHERLRIMSINTNNDWSVYNVYSTLNHHDPETAQQRQWVEQVLTDARIAEQKVIVISHIGYGGDEATTRSARWWDQVANNYSDVIILHLSGHLHEDNIILALDHMTTEAKSVNYLVGPTTSNLDINPTMRMFYLDSEDGYQPVDFESFYLDIRAQDHSIGVPPAVMFSYSAREEYDLEDLSPASWRDFTLRMVEDVELYIKFMDNTHSQAKTYNFDIIKWTRIICYIWFTEENEADECIHLARNLTTPPTTTTQPGSPSPTTQTTSSSTASPSSGTREPSHVITSPPKYINNYKALMIAVMTCSSVVVVLMVVGIALLRVNRKTKHEKK